MKTILITSIMSAFLGAMLAVSIVQGPSAIQATQISPLNTAQQPVYQQPSQAQPVYQQPIVGQANLGGTDDAIQPVNAQPLFSGEDQTNISVYENVNRSVVNINTKVNRPDFWFVP